MILDTIGDLDEEREKRKQRRNHLNNIDEMIEKIQSEHTSLRMKRAASYTRLRHAQKARSVAKRTKNGTICSFYV